MMIYVFITIATVLAFMIPVFRYGKSQKQYSPAERLNIGICDPFTADSVLNALAPYSERHPQVSVYITAADEEALLKRYNEKHFDVVFLKVCDDATAKDVILRRSPLLARYTDIPVETLGEEDVTMRMLCRKEQYAVSQLFEDGRME